MTRTDEELTMGVTGDKGEVVFKVLVIGDGSVGKTTLLRKYVHHQFETEYIPTVGVNILKEQIEINNKTVNLMFWDIAGQPQFHLLHKVYYNGANGVILMFDLTNSPSFSNVNNWYNELVKYKLENTPIVLVGNKSDLKHERKIIEPMAHSKMEQLGISAYYETSALDGSNVKAVFNKIIQLMMERKKHF
ncbi:MAG: GTP-binding protein [Candidatus Lokiarchaeota archaeon]|nr:GTP-binding protein [Candidatus Lokiarchaeota archaeon]